MHCVYVNVADHPRNSAFRLREGYQQTFIIIIIIIIIDIIIIIITTRVPEEQALRQQALFHYLKHKDIFTISHFRRTKDSRPPSQTLFRPLYIILSF